MTNEERRTTLTDEERRKLVADLNVVPWEIYRNALLEIERLTALLEDYRLTFGDIHEVKGGPNRDNLS